MMHDAAPMMGGSDDVLMIDDDGPELELAGPRILPRALFSLLLRFGFFVVSPCWLLSGQNMVGSVRPQIEALALARLVRRGERRGGKSMTRK
jgi:hypothetical protein